MAEDGGPLAPQSEEEARLQRDQSLALSPELQERLVHEFPPGSGEQRLVLALREQGFILLPPCKGDRSIRSAAFNQHGGGLIWDPLTAKVFWKVDDRGKIVWTKGFAWYTGL